MLTVDNGVWYGRDSTQAIIPNLEPVMTLTFASSSLTRSQFRPGMGMLLCAACALLALMAAGVHAADVLRVLVYLGLFALLPGYAVAAHVLRGPFTPGMLAAMALCLGLAIQILLMLLPWAFGVLWLAYLIPPAAAAVLLRPGTRNRLAALSLPWVSVRSDVAWTIAALALPTLGLWAISSYIGDRVHDHYIEQVLGVLSLQSGWPPQNIMAVGVPYSNNYAAHLWMLGAVELLGVELMPLAARSTLILFVAIAVLSIILFCRHTMKLPWWTVALVIIKVFLVVGWPPIAATVFLAVIPTATTLTLSPLLGFIAVFTLLTILNDRERHGASFPGTLLLMFALVFFAMGARGVTGPLLICAFSLLFLVSSFRERATDWRRLAYVGISVAATVAALAAFFSVGQGISGTSFLVLSWQPVDWLLRQREDVAVAHWLVSQEVDRVLAAYVAFFIIAFFQAGFLLPGFLYKLWLMTREPWSDMETVLLGISIAGISAVFLTEALGGSQFSFIHYSNISMSILGGCGWWRLLSASGLKTGWRIGPGGGAVLAATFALFVVHLSEVPSDVIRATPFGLRNLLDSEAGPKGLAALTKPAELRPFCAGHERAYPLLDNLPDGRRHVLLFVVDGKTITHCHAQWWTAKAGVPTLLPRRLAIYASWRGSLNAALQVRSQLLARALKAAANGEADMEALTLLAEDMAADAENIYLMVPATVHRAAEPVVGFDIIAENEDLVLWRAAKKPGPET